MSLKNHSNVELHDKLIKAFREGKLDDDFIRDNLSWKSKGRNGAAAYINWDCTLALLGPHPALEWFAGVSEPKHGDSFFSRSPDHIRDTRSYGTYWSVDRDELSVTKKEELFFYVEQSKEELYAEVFKWGHFLAVYKGSPAVDLKKSLVPAERTFWGRVLWSMADNSLQH